MQSAYLLLRKMSCGFALFGLACTLTAGEWTPLFDGRSVEHWNIPLKGGWTVEDGALTPTSLHKRGNYIWSRETYGDFELKLEFKMSEKCNSGVFFRTDPENPVQGGFEIQVFDSHGKAEVGAHDCGALYDARAPRVNAAKPAGEWNALFIRAQGSRVLVELNGTKVVEADLEDWTTARQNPDGTKNKFNTALKDLPRKGHLGLQYHGHPVWFRDIQIRALK